MSVNIHKLFFFVLFLQIIQAQEKKTFQNLDEVLAFTKEKNTTFKNSELQSQLATLTYKTAIGNTLNPRIPVSVQLIDNYKLQQSYLPGPIFGLPDGTYKTVSMGLQYNTTFNVQPQFDILNLANVALVKSAKINAKLVESQNLLIEQNIDNQINAIYFNILSFQEQIKIVNKNIALATQLATITQNRFKEGIGRKQDANDAEANLLLLQNKLTQLETGLAQQYTTLQVFVENATLLGLTQNLWDFEKNNQPMETQGKLQVDNAKLQWQQLQQDTKVAKLQNLPTLGFVSSFNWLDAGNNGFFAQGNSWQNFSYWGLKLSWDFPTSVQKLSTWKSKSIQAKLQENNAKHAEIENSSKNKNMQLDYENAVIQLDNLKKIYALKKDTFEKNNNQYLENILSLDKLLTSQYDMLNSEINLVSGLANIGFYKYKILINNKF